MPFPLRDSEYLYGIHDPGGEHIMLEQGIPGWVLFTEAIGVAPNDHRSKDYRPFSDQGLGVMVRLNAGYGGVGTIPFENQYDDFARRCANFVRASHGAHIWIVGNEMNHPIEWPGADWEWNLRSPRPVSPDTVGEQITPMRYARCYRKVRDSIHALPGHEHDQVLVGAVAPWNALSRYSGNRVGDWVKYFQDILNRIGEDECDGITIHTYTHGAEPDKIDSTEKMPRPFERRHFNFRTYQDFMHVIPKAMRHLPVYITETDQDIPWRNEDTGWVQRAYGEIDYWNKNNEQQIRALILYRWSQIDQWGIDGKQGVLEDFRQAMDFGYKPREIVIPKDESEDEKRKPYRAEITLAEAIKAGAVGEDIAVELTIKNTGSNTWSKEGENAFHVGYHWFDSANHKANAEDYRTALPEDVEPDQEVTLPIKIGMPYQSGAYRLAIDLVHEGITWFAWRGNRSLAMKVIVLTSADAHEQHFPETGKTVKGPFLNLLLKLGLDATGYPASDELVEDGVTVQHFQRLTMEEYEPGKVRVRSVAEQPDEGDSAYSEAIAGATFDAVYPPPTSPRNLGEAMTPAIVQVAHLLPRGAAELHTRTAEDIEYIVISHTGVRPGIAVERLAQAHLRRWPGIACHYLVEADGIVYQTCAVSEAVDDQRDWIYHGIIVYVAGNFSDDIPPNEQLDALAALIAWLLDEYDLGIDKMLGASELLRTQSPGKQWLEDQRWKDLLLARVTALRGDHGSRGGGTEDDIRETSDQIEPAPKTPDDPLQRDDELNVILAASGQSRAVVPQRSKAQVISKPEMVNLVSQLPKHPTNRYEARSLEQITHIAVHHSAAPASITPQRIAHHHVFGETQQWPGMGYHYDIGPDGTINHTQALELASNHVFGHNHDTVGVCLAGNFDHAIPTPAQLAATGHLIAWLMQELDIPLQNVWGHKAFPRATTSCPGKQWDGGQRWRDLLLQEIHAVLNPGDDPSTKLLDHYLFLQQHTAGGTGQECEQAASNYIARFRPTFGFSLATAMLARRVTLVDCATDSSPEEEKQLRQAGCQVERIAGRDIAETQQILDRLAESGQRFIKN